MPLTHQKVAGGVVGSCASMGFGAEQRASEGKQGGIATIIYVSAFILQVGETLLGKLGGQIPPWMRVEVKKKNESLPPGASMSDFCRARRCSSSKLPRSGSPIYRKTRRRNGTLALLTLRSGHSQVLRHMSHGTRCLARISSAMGMDCSYRLSKRRWPMR